MAKRRNWTDAENRAIVRAYFFMLAREIDGVKFNKSAIRRECLKLLDNRSAGSYEMKCCNISAHLQKMGAPFVQGYKPRGNAQKSLADAIAEEFRAHMRRVA